MVKAWRRLQPRFVEILNGARACRHRDLGLTSVTTGKPLTNCVVPLPLRFRIDITDVPSSALVAEYDPR
jgi:hypothetical protein